MVPSLSYFECTIFSVAFFRFCFPEQGPRSTTILDRRRDENGVNTLGYERGKTRSTKLNPKTVNFSILGTVHIGTFIYV